MNNTLNNSQPQLAGKRVLITGGLGFIGSNLAERCVADGADVAVYDCLDPHSGGNIYNVHEIENDIDIIVSDVRNLDDLCQAVRQKDIVFNCAAHTSHSQSMTDPLADIDVNCRGTINLLEAARRFNPDVKIVHVGTSTQMGRMIHSEADETHPEFPTDIYSANKSVSEKYVLIYGNAYGMRTTVVRLANNFGPRSNIRNPNFGFINYFIGLALSGRNLTVFGDGGQLRNASYVGDTVDALLLAALNDAANGEALFAVADTQCNVAEIARSICECIGGDVQFVEWPKEREAIEVGDAIISNEKIKRLLGWSPRVSMSEGMRRTQEFFRPHLEHYIEPGAAKAA
ncbi:MAG: SDR family NAD(P)-dependent oxidoreductase [Planctomycetaceae bacterium]|jgi:UDP-glucose 4-epimerase|nr:SDR family NAD(P)-dependent oxidoreductase [Planctomycetaceae bacterium]MBT6486358.1 SDR family NAD(P)-dependent oxidoreductase [Planctomycetaceae bacterium]MBT6494486.1 SDR family NAD(P)-dependent oxidoreductase [Planctomycetaceae bacterium]